MKQQWQKLVLRIDAMQLRERVFLFLTVIVCGLALADTLWLAPAQLAHKQATLRLSAQATELQRLRDELRTLAQPVDASKVVRDEIAAANQTLEGINQEIRAIAPLAEGGPAIEQALVEFLRSQTGLTLLSTGTAKQDLVNAAGQTTERAGSQAVLARRGWVVLDGEAG